MSLEPLPLHHRPRFALATAGAVAALLALVFLVTPGGHPRNSTRDLDENKSEIEELGRGVQLDTINGQDVVWELPTGAPQAVVLFAHGCHHSAGDLWPPSPACPACLGLPEETRLRRAVLRRGMALLAVSSLDRAGKRCWGELRRDGGAAVAAIAREVVRREGLQGVPFYTMGASSGGQMALTLPQLMPEVAGVYSQVRGVPPSALSLPGGRPFPPTAFVHMPRDPNNLAVIVDDIAALRAAGTPVLDVRILPRPVTAAFLAERSPLLRPRLAAAAVAALQRDGLVAANGTLTEPPRPATPRWAPAVAPVLGGLSLALDESHLGELLNLAWAKHELVSDEAEAVLAWLQSGGALRGLHAARAAAAAAAEAGGGAAPAARRARARRRRL